ncbi:MAG: hypothetical protein ACWGHO_04580 [Candidatus Moraniibacteriota bacterium]
MNKLEPKNVMDLILDIDEFIAKMKNSSPEEAMEIAESLEKFSKDAVANLNIDAVENKKLIAEMTDQLYRSAMKWNEVGVHTNGYISIVLHRLFWEMSQRGIRIFYVLDNSLRDDRFRLILEQFPPAGFAVITPHIANDLKYEPATSITENLSYEDVEIKIKEALDNGKNIFYVERDNSVDYLERVVELAKETSDEYAKIYRSSAPESSEIVEIGQDVKIISNYE